MTLEEALSQLARKFTVVDGPVSAIAPNGEQYVTIMSGGTPAEGERVQGIFFSEDAAIADWWLWLQAYASTRKGNTLYWRVRPEVGSMTIFKDEKAFLDIDHLSEVTVYMVRARLMIA